MPTFLLYKKMNLVFAAGVLPWFFLPHGLFAVENCCHKICI